MPVGKNEVIISLSNLLEDKTRAHRTLAASSDAHTRPHEENAYFVQVIKKLKQMVPMVTGANLYQLPVQGYLAHKRTPPPRTLQYALTSGRVDFLGGVALSSYLYIPNDTPFILCLSNAVADSV